MPLKVVCLWRSLLNNYLQLHVRTIEKLRCKIWNYWQIIIFISNQEKKKTQGPGKIPCLFLLQSYTKLKEALRVCAGFRGTYLDFKDKADDQNAKNIAENAERL